MSISLEIIAGNSKGMTFSKKKSALSLGRRTEKQMTKSSGSTIGHYKCWAGWPLNAKYLYGNGEEA